MKQKNVVLQCEKHRKYKGIANPRTDCLICWKIRVDYLVNKIKQLQAE